jgi:oligogalacturonide lyase
MPNKVLIDTDHLSEQFKITNGAFNCQLLYFTSTSLLSDDKHLVFLSIRFGNPNIFLMNIDTGTEIQLTHNNEGILKSYVYFDGTPYRGLGKASISVDATSGKIYFIQGRSICAADTLGKIRVLTEYPKGQMTAFTHVSSDGKLLCVPTVDERALDGEIQLYDKPEYDIDERVRSEKLSSYLRIYDTETGKEIICEKVPGAWITHVQFSPADNSQILYNNEWPSDCGIRRIWLWDGKLHRALRTIGDGRSKDDWTCHEMWERDGSAIIYHGAYKNGPAYIGRMKPDGSEITEISFPKGWTRYGHFTEGKPGMLVTDGYYEDKIINENSDLVAKDPSIDTGIKKSEISGKWICLLKINWDKKIVKWIPLCLHCSTWESQDCHPHPIFNHNADKIYFTSDKDGVRSIYSVDVPEV